MRLSPRQQQQGEGGGGEGQEVRERLERNIFRAGMRILRGDRRALEKNLEERGVAVDLEKLVLRERESVCVCVCVCMHACICVSLKMRKGVQ